MRQKAGLHGKGNGGRFAIATLGGPHAGDFVGCGSKPANHLQLGMRVGEIIGYIGVGLDITQRKKNEEHPLSGNARRADRVRADGGTSPITVSIGFAVYPTDGTAAQDLLESADRHLYRRKKDGQMRKVSVG